MSLFSKTTIIQQEAVPYCKSVDIHEHKAPTDESIKLLNEMQEKVMNNIMATFRVEDNTLNAAVIYLFQGTGFDRLDYRVKFTFNGKEYLLNGEIPRRNFVPSHKYGSNEVYEALAKSLVILIAEKVLHNNAKTLFNP
jgi:hypothetical protein